MNRRTSGPEWECSLKYLQIYFLQKIEAGTKGDFLVHHIHIYTSGSPTLIKGRNTVKVESIQRGRVVCADVTSALQTCPTTGTMVIFFLPFDSHTPRFRRSGYWTVNIW